MARETEISTNDNMNYKLIFLEIEKLIRTASLMVKRESPKFKLWVRILCGLAFALFL